MILNKYQLYSEVQERGYSLTAKVTDDNENIYFAKWIKGIKKNSQPSKILFDKLRHLKKAIHLSEYDDISILAETLARLVSEYRETYQKFRQTIANRYKQLQEASQYIDEQTEKLNQLTEKNEDIFTDEMQASKNPLKYAEVHNLAEQGIDHTEIAQKTKLPVGEVNLLLSLSEHIELEE